MLLSPRHTPVIYYHQNMTSLYIHTHKSSLIKFTALLTCSIALLAMGGYAGATTYQLPQTSGDTVLELFPNGDATTTIVQDETLLDVALRYTLGQTEIIKLNPKMDRWLVKKGQVVRLPNRRVLPDTPHNGITLNISEFRMYYYPPGQTGEVMSFAHGIGRQDWKTPLGKTSVVRKIKDPAWHPPESIRKEHAANGDPLPEIVPPGPHNPLGTRALYLNLPGEYRIHGTDVDKIYGIGMQITHGCVRMYPEDVETLYDVVPVGTAVYMVKQPIKVGWLDNVLYVEAHPDLEGEEMGQEQRYAVALKLIQKATKEEMPEFDQKALNQALKELDGEPVAVYERVPLMEPQEVAPSQEKVFPDADPVSAPPGKGSPGGYYRGI
jgi:L,D-transpeptidase ErfK/SrfK